MKGLLNGFQIVINGIESIFNGIKLGIQFLVNLVISIIKLLEILKTTITTELTLIATLPPWLIATATLGIGVAILYQILGRNVGK